MSDDTQQLLDAIRQLTTDAQEATRRHFDATAERIQTASRHEFKIATESLIHEIQLLADGVASLGERMSREIGRLDEKVDHGFSDTQAMIKFSHAELDRRVRSLEEAFNELRSRVDRLEGATH